MEPFELIGELEVYEHLNAGAEGDTTILVGGVNVGEALLARLGDSIHRVAVGSSGPHVRLRIEIVPLGVKG